MLDLTKNVRLTPGLQKKYNIARGVLLTCFFLGALFVIHRILFPIISLDYAFAVSSSLKNTLLPPTLTDGTLLSKGMVTANSSMIFNADPLGNFSSVDFQLTTDAKTKNLTGSKFTVQKSYKAFFYPQGQAVGFADGSLLTTNGGDYYLVSNGLLHKFDNTDIILKLGYPKNAFQEISEDDLKYNPEGKNISDDKNYPDDTFFNVEGAFYQLKNQQLIPFISPRAFLSNHEQIQAIMKTADFLNNYPISETSSVGFADGTLASSPESIFILSEGKSYPIADATTFLAMGFDWKNVVALAPEEFGFYVQQKQFTVDQPHPNGTLFQDQNTKKLFLIKNGQKLAVESLAVAKTYAKQNTILINSENLNIQSECQLQKKFSLWKHVFSCEADLEKIHNFPGNNYRFSLTPNNDAKIKTLRTTFSTPLSWDNMMTSLSKIKAILKGNYARN